MNYFKNLNKPFFIAEVSSNHDQSLDRCLEFVRVASEIGCDAVKFQFFRVEDLFSKEAIKAKPNILKRKNWELNELFLEKIHKLCVKLNIQFGITPFSIGAIDFLSNYVDFFKIASYELLWHDLILECAKINKPLIVSTGMSNLEEIQSLVSILEEKKFDNLSLLHCSSAYPTPPKECNLSAIKTMKNIFNCPVGWSDHTVNEAVLYRAINKWDANIIEFHLDLDGNGAEYSSGHCWLPRNIEKVINTINTGFDCDGNGKKVPAKSEISDRDWRADPSDGLRPMKYLRDKI